LRQKSTTLFDKLFRDEFIIIPFLFPFLLWQAISMPRFSAYDLQ